MIDFDKAFEQYVMCWFKQHHDEYEDESALEESMPALYEQWASSPCDEANGVSPRAYFEQFRPQQLLEQLVTSCDGNNNPCSLLLDRIADSPVCAEGLAKIIEGDGCVKLKMIAVNLLTEMGAEHPLDRYVVWLRDGNTDSDLRELGIEILNEHANEVAPQLYDLLPEADAEQKKMIAEILVNAKKDERTYQLLTQLFAAGENLPLYAGFLGKYGDERASAMLYRALDTCNYLEYIEIKNAIERMGGTVDDMRDFSDDVYYRAIKNLK